MEKWKWRLDGHLSERASEADARGEMPLRVFLRRDEAIREEIPATSWSALWVWLHGRSASTCGRAALRGDVTPGLLVPVVERLCQSVDGVVKVRSHLTGSSEVTRFSVASP